TRRSASRRETQRARRDHDATLHRSRLLLQPRPPLASFQFFALVFQREACRIRLLRSRAIPGAPRARHSAAHLARPGLSVPGQSFPLVPQILGVLFVLRHSRQDSRMGTRSREVGFPSVLARFMFAVIDFAAPRGPGETPPPPLPPGAAGDPAKHRARQTGIRGETYAYWYLRRHGYVLVARNFTSPGIKGEIDMVGYDGPTLAFVEVKTRTAVDPALPSQSSARPAPLRPDEAVNREKRRNLSRMARQFLRARHIETAPCRCDVLAIDTRPGQKPVVRLHKGAFNATQQQHGP